MSADFLTAARAHWARYPLMEPQDFAKLAYQSEFGPEHLLRDSDSVLEALLAEQKGTVSRPPESIGNSLCRFHITRDLSPRWELPLIGRMFVRTAGDVKGTEAGLLEKLAQLAALPVPGLGEYLELWRREGCPAVHHSAVFRSAYGPHYRVLRMDLAQFLPALIPLEKLVRGERERPALIAVDGRCGSGKTGFAALTDVLERAAEVVHMDDFYLPPDRRAENWMEIPAGNMDLERFREEVLERRRDRPLIVEGTYSQHPSLARYYGYKIFLTCGREEQTRRLRAREGDYYPTFDRVWRTLEERYFAACGTEAAADLVVDTTDFFD